MTGSISGLRSKASFRSLDSRGRLSQRAELEKWPIASQGATTSFVHWEPVA